MTIIDFMRQKLTEYPKISEFLTDSDIHVDRMKADHKDDILQAAQALIDRGGK